MIDWPMEPSLVQPLLEQHRQDDWPADGAGVCPAVVEDVPARAHISSRGLRLLRQVLEPAVRKPMHLEKTAERLSSAPAGAEHGPHEPPWQAVELRVWSSIARWWGGAA